MNASATSRAGRLYASGRRYLTGQTPPQLRATWHKRTAGRDIPTDHFQTAVYFVGEDGDLMALRDLYEPLAQWHAQSPTVVVCRSPAAALTLLDECPVPVIHAGWVADIERFAARQRLRMVLYVDQHTNNFQMMRMNSVLHVYVGAGPHATDGLLTGQVKCYDYAFVRGLAVLDDMRHRLIGYEVGARTKAIGAPQGSISIPAWLRACQEVVDECEVLLRGHDEDR